MLFTIFSTPKAFNSVREAFTQQTAKSDVDYIQLHAKQMDHDTTISGIIFEIENKTILLCNTYNLKLSTQYAQSLGEHFEPYSFSDREFRDWFFVKSHQVIECEYFYQDVERKSTAFDLKRMDTFKSRLEKSTITAMTFSLERFNVIITAREEGRISISPDIDVHTLIRLFCSLLGHAIPVGA